MLTRRRFVGYSALSSTMLAYPQLMRSALGQGAGQQPVRLAILGSVYRHGSNMQTIGDRFLVGYPFEGDWYMPNVKVVSMYVDQAIRKADARPTEFDLAMIGAGRPGGGGQRPAGVQGAAAANAEPLGPMSDLSASRAQQFGFRLSRNIPDALRCGGDKIAVDAVLTIVE
jgi:hypothetical protein